MYHFVGTAGIATMSWDPKIVYATSPWPGASNRMNCPAYCLAASKRASMGACVKEAYSAMKAGFFQGHVDSFCADHISQRTPDMRGHCAAACKKVFTAPGTRARFFRK